MLDCVEADRPQLAGLPYGGCDVVESEVLEQTQHLHVLAFARLAQTRLQQTPQSPELCGQFPAGQWGCLIQCVRFPFQQRQVVQRIEDQLFPLVAAAMTGDLLAAATDDHFPDIAFEQHFAMTIRHRHRVGVRAVAHQRQ